MVEQPDLTGVPGLGPSRRAALAARGVRSMADLQGLKLAELAAVPGIGMGQARRIRQFLRERGLPLAADEEDGAGALAAARAGEEPDTMGESNGALQPDASLQTEASPSAETESRDGAEAQRAVEAEDRAEREERVEAGGGTAPEDGDGEAAPEVALRDEIQRRREELPETAVALMDAIRQAAVLPALTRQITRLLIISGEFTTETRPVTEEQCRRARAVLRRAGTALQRALERQRYRRKDQKRLAGRIREWRQELERLLERG